MRVGEHPGKRRSDASLLQVRSFTHRNAATGRRIITCSPAFIPPADSMAAQAKQSASLDGLGDRPQARCPRCHPPYVRLLNMHNSGSSAYLGPDAVPFTIEADPASPGFKVDLQPPLSVDASLADRQSLLQDVDRFRSTRRATGQQRRQGAGVFAQRAMDLMTPPLAKKAFDIHQERPAKLRDAYGRSTKPKLPDGPPDRGRGALRDGRSFQLGHALATTSCWKRICYRSSTLPFLRCSTICTPRVVGENDGGGHRRTGRTPKDKDAGRDHWSRCFTVLLGGGGIHGYRVVGRRQVGDGSGRESPYSEDLCHRA